MYTIIRFPESKRLAVQFSDKDMPGTDQDGYVWFDASDLGLLNLLKVLPLELVFELLEISEEKLKALQKANKNTRKKHLQSLFSQQYIWREDGSDVIIDKDFIQLYFGHSLTQNEMLGKIQNLSEKATEKMIKIFEDIIGRDITQKTLFKSM